MKNQISKIGILAAGLFIGISASSFAYSETKSLEETLGSTKNGISADTTKSNKSTSYTKVTKKTTKTVKPVKVKKTTKTTTVEPL